MSTRSSGGSVNLLAGPHHDGSALYVSNLAPALGEVVRVRLRVPHDHAPSAVHVRLVVDGEQKFVEARVEHADEIETWWIADLTCHNPVTGYRFLLDGGRAGYAWLNGAGLHRRDVPDASDFRLVAHSDPPPRWARDAVVYQIFPDRFARSAAADSRAAPGWALPAPWDEPVDGRMGPASRQLYGGDLDGVGERLDYLVDLGVTVIYLTPFFPAHSNHRYDATTFAAVDPLLGGDEALRRLTDAAHARGIRVMGDFTTNHTGSAHEWFLAARADPRAPERDFYFWEGQEYVAWLGVKSLPKLNYDSVTLRERLFDDPQGVVRKWLGPDGGLDGWRVDVANMTGRYGAQDHNHEVAALMRDAMVSHAPGSLLVGEHVHDFSVDVPGTGWHGVMNYAGFTKPVWTWLSDPVTAPDFLGSPVIVPRLGGVETVETIRDFTSRVSWQAVTHSFNLVGSHDTTRIRTLVGADPRLVDVAAGLLLTMPGIPMITYGDEIGMAGEWGEDGRRPMPWEPQDWDARLREVYRSLIGLRRSSAALRHGGLRWVYADHDAIVYLREAPDEVALVHCSRSAHDPVCLDARDLGDVAAGASRFGHHVQVAGGAVTLSADGPSVNVWIYPSRSLPGRSPGAKEA